MLMPYVLVGIKETKKKKIGGPGQQVWKLVASVIISTLICAAPVRGLLARFKSHVKAYESTERLPSIIPISAYRTVSDCAVMYSQAT